MITTLNLKNLPFKKRSLKIPLLNVYLELQKHNSGWIKRL
jgi:hypothetical protein